MSNIILPNKSIEYALKESSGSLLVDINNKPVSALDIGNKEKPKYNTAYSMPIGEKFRYYKIKIPNTDTYAVSWVYNRPIPKGTESITAEKAFVIMFGTTAAYEGRNKFEWRKVNNAEKGSVVVKDNSELDTAALPNANAEEFESSTLKEFERHNL